MIKKNTKDYKNITDRTLTFKYGTSRGFETYGWNTCGCWFNGEKVGFCIGGGYDMTGTSFALFIADFFQEELKRINAKNFYGFSFYNKKTNKRQNRWSKNCDYVYLDGACGFTSIQRIFNKLGYALKYVAENKKETYYTIELFKGSRY